MRAEEFRYLDVCAGISASTVAWKGLGWRAAAYAEIDGCPRAVLAHHYPDVPLHGDFTTIGAEDYGAIDLLVGGTPCQDFSVAGLRAGLDGDRGNLTLEFLRLAGRTRPRWLLWENVPGVLSIDGGRAFGAVLGGMGELGYGFAYRVLDAQYFGVPQRRRRVFALGYLGDWRRAAAVFSERESMLRHPPPGRGAGQNAPTLPSRRTAGGGLGTDFDLDGGLIASTGDTAHCLNAGGMGRQDYESETFIAHALRGEGFDASEDGTGRGTPIVPVACPDVAATLTRGAESAGKGGYAGRRQEDDFNIVAFDTTQITSDQNYSNPKPGDPCHPLAAGAHPPALMQGGVRRLTPRECERLQGFPDDYTLVPYRKGMMADGPRYKMLGNSMAVPVMRWIGERIAAVEAIEL